VPYQRRSAERSRLIFQGLHDPHAHFDFSLDRFTSTSLQPSPEKARTAAIYECPLSTLRGAKVSWDKAGSVTISVNAGLEGPHPVRCPTLNAKDRRCPLQIPAHILVQPAILGSKDKCRELVVGKFIFFMSYRVLNRVIWLAKSPFSWLLDAGLSAYPDIP